MTGFVKLFQSLLGSSVWADKDSVLRVWIAMLVLKDRHHVVRLSVPGLATISRVTPEQCREALAKFREPDPESTSTANEGRKIRDLAEGGWLILNGEVYAKMLSLDERREYQRIKQAEYRRRRKDLGQAAGCEGATRAIVEGLNQANAVPLVEAQPKVAFGALSPSQAFAAPDKPFDEGENAG